MRLFLFVLFLLILPDVYAQGIGISPAQLEFDLQEGEVAERQIIIYSNSPAQENFVAKTDLEGLTIHPDTGFINQEKKLIVSVRGRKPGKRDGYITLQFKGDGRGMRINTGAMVKVLMNVREKESQISVVKGVTITSGIVLVGLASYFAWKNQP